MKRLAPLAVALALLLAACGEEAPAPAPTGEGPLVSSVTPSAATLEKMAAADRMDGTEDHVITRCPNCGLHMAGKPEFTCTLGDYATHSCSARCNLQVCEDPDGVFAEAETPDK